MPVALASWSDCSRRLLFRVGAHTLAIDVQDEAALAVLESVYEHLRCEEPRGAQCSASLRRLGDGRLHVRFGRQHLPLSLAAGPGADARAYYSAAREVFVRCAASQKGVLALYGALVATPRGGVLLLGPASIGKSVLALHLARLGAAFMGDETALLNVRSGEVAALPRRPSLRESALPWLPPELSERVAGSRCEFQTERGRFWYALDERESGVRPSARPVPLHAVCLLHRRGESVAVERLQLADALPLIVARAYSRPRELAQTAALRHSLRGIACFDVTLGEPAESAAAILAQVSQCG